MLGYFEPSKGLFNSVAILVVVYQNLTLEGLEFD